MQKILNNFSIITDEEKINIVRNFKSVFIEQKKNNIDTVFGKNFGIHNGYSMEEYVKVEMDEFALKCDKFNLTMDATIICFDIGNDFVYFALGEKNDKAVFEGMFKWDNVEKKFSGNQYVYKIEPKMQFIKNNKNKTINNIRKINIKSNNNQVNVKNIMSWVDGVDFIFIKNELVDIFGGKFYSLIYSDNDISNKNTYWNNITIIEDDNKKKNYNILMRGVDHPLFDENLFPVLINEKEFIVNENIYPVIITVYFEDNTNIAYKYPLEKTFKLDKKIKTICLTDTLSFDWIVNY